MKKVEAIVDGGMIGGNPGKGGWGGRFRIYNNGQVIDEKYYGGTFGEEVVTNNIAEWRAVIGAIQIFIEHYSQYDIFRIISDSKLVVMQATGQWQCKDAHLARLQWIFNGLNHTLQVATGQGILYIVHKRREYTTVAHDHIAKILGRSK